MAFGDNNSPAGNGWRNITDSFHTADAGRGMSAWEGYTLLRDLRYTYEKIVEETLQAGTSRVVATHGHGDLTQTAGDSDGIVKRCTVANQNFSRASTLYDSWTVTDSAWIAIDRHRIMTTAFRGLHCEVEFRCATGEDVIFQISNVARSIRSGSAYDHAIVESNATASATFHWHTVSGQLDAAGAATIEQLPTDGPTSVTDTRNCLDRWDILTSVRLAPGEGSATVDIRNVHWWTALDSDA